ncbi:translation initiation factor eIF-2B subunit gamma, putative [Plasmodium chabaudi chabaudi]|uniref:Translation initiation factor eIF2B subunit gamma n=1 Tax=Plasmodium chabaudi chabaudi TaxID=31271 RepID=A0A1D3LIF7_PLACU|nr:translation initiation factor eIF-2B subunit gamma, putative [Plasmodium chabaudi chabaudi]
MTSVNQSRAPSGGFVEFQVVILTNDENGFSSELSESTCKGLLKVSNRCMIYYIVKNIIEQKLKYITIVVNNKYYDDMVKYINEEFPDNYKSDDKKNKNSYCIDIEPYTTDANEEIGSIQSLLHIRDKIKSDFIVVNTDILGFVDFHSLANLFRGENALCAMLLLEENDVNNNNKKKKEMNEEYLNLENNVWVCIDKNSKVVSIADAVTMKQDGKLKIPKINLLRHKKFILKTDLVDSHVYIFKNYVLDIIEKKKNFSSIKYDLIPYLVNIQNMEKIGEYYNKSEFKFNMYKTLISEYSADQSQNENAGNEINTNGTTNVHENVENVVCYVQPKMNGFCQRINNIPNFFKANLLFCVTRHEQLKDVVPPYFFFLPSDKVQSYKDCIIGSGFEHEESISLKKSVLGKNVKIKKNSNINRSICMDNITINEGCQIQNSIICNHVVIEENCKLIDCIVRENCVIEKNSIYEKETLPLFIS